MKPLFHLYLRSFCDGRHQLFIRWRLYHSTCRLFCLCRSPICVVSIVSYGNRCTEQAEKDKCKNSEQRLCPSLLNYDSPYVKKQIKSPYQESHTNTDSEKLTPGNTPSHGNVKLTLAERLKNLPQTMLTEVRHYYHGFRLLFLDVKVALRYCWKMLRGKTLTRRERKQLVRTVADLFRLLPFSLFIIIPFMELALPIYLKLFPSMLPSTFQSADKEQEKRRQVMKSKMEIAKFLQETLVETNATMSTSRTNQLSLQEFQKFMQQVRETGLMASTEDILRFTHLFDGVTLDALNSSQIKGLCNILEINTKAPAPLLRLLIEMKIRRLRIDDQTILSEGIESLAAWDLQNLCRERGMRAFGMTEARLREQLNQWIDLHIEKNVPVLLLLFSRTMYLPETFQAEELLTQAIMQLPESASDEAVLAATNLSRNTKDINRIRFKIIKEKELKLKQEEISSQPVTSAPAEEDITADKAMPSDDKKFDIVDKAPYLEDADAMLHAQGTDSMRGSIDVDSDVKIQTKISLDDMAQLESALESLYEGRDAMDDYELQELKDNMASTKSVQPVTMPQTQIEQKTAQKLESKVSGLINDMDIIIDNIYREKNQLLENIEVKQVRAKHLEGPQLEERRANIVRSIRDEMDRVVNLNDLLLALRRIQKVPDDARWQQILAVLDEDEDGKIEVKHVLKVVKMLGEENVNLSSDQMKSVLELIDKEALLEKRKKQKDD